MAANPHRADGAGQHSGVDGGAELDGRAGGRRCRRRLVEGVVADKLLGQPDVGRPGGQRGEPRVEAGAVVKHVPEPLRKRPPMERVANAPPRVLVDHVADRHQRGSVAGGQDRQRAAARHSGHLVGHVHVPGKAAERPQQRGGVGQSGLLGRVDGDGPRQCPSVAPRDNGRRLAGGVREAADLEHLAPGQVVVGYLLGGQGQGHEPADDDSPEPRVLEENDSQPLERGGRPARKELELGRKGARVADQHEGGDGRGRGGRHRLGAVLEVELGGMEPDALLHQALEPAARQRPEPVVAAADDVVVGKHGQPRQQVGHPRRRGGRRRHADDMAGELDRLVRRERGGGAVNRRGRRVELARGRHQRVQRGPQQQRLALGHARGAHEVENVPPLDRGLVLDQPLHLGPVAVLLGPLLPPALADDGEPGGRRALAAGDDVVRASGSERQVVDRVGRRPRAPPLVEVVSPGRPGDSQMTGGLAVDRLLPKQLDRVGLPARERGGGSLNHPQKHVSRVVGTASKHLALNRTSHAGMNDNFPRALGSPRATWRACLALGHVGRAR